MIIYKTFQTPNAAYVYDRDRERLLRVPEADYLILKELENQPDNDENCILASIRLPVF